MNNIFLIKLRSSLARPARVGLIFVTLAALLGWTGSWHWFPELFAHFFLQYALLLIILTALLFWTSWEGADGSRHWRWGALLVTLLVGFAVSPFWQPANLPTRGAPPASHGSLNLLQFNAAQNTDALAQWLIQHRKEVDVILVLEAGTGFAAVQETLASEFPHHIEQLQDGPFGIALMSRYPLYEAEALDVIGDTGFPTLAARVITPAGILSVVGIHPPPPLGQELAELRDHFMRELAGQLATQLTKGEPTLVFGDFNSTIWSPRLRDFMAQTGLRDAQQGQGALGSWPALTARYSGLLGIPIDLTLVSENIVVQQRHAGESLGSDHLPVLTRITY
jgi:endonuclease/exonuclease/phosphatase (EEP) superfamily protein YafD